MNRSSVRIDPTAAWSPYDPQTDGAWNLSRVAHLHRRAGFSAPWPVLQRDLKDGPAASIARMLDGEQTTADGQTASQHAEFMDAMALRFAAANALPRVQGVWLYRMIFAAHPLQERMTLFWHNHFATSNAKVANTSLMQSQNRLIREHALGDFQTMLRQMARDPAMLAWLDCTANRKAHPNENYAREVMELFTLGRGRYTEIDIQQAARAFTGSFVQNDRFKDVPAQHDDGEKTILGQTGRFKGDDVATILLDQPACAEFLCVKLYRMFVSEVDAPSPELIAPLANAMRKANYDIKQTVATILRSKLFFDEKSRRRRIKSPVELAVGTIRALKILKPTVSSDALNEATIRMGQSLYEPPSVAGWDGGPSWINTTTTLARSNFVLAILGKDGGLGGRVDPQRLAEKNGVSDTSAFFVDLLVQDAFDAKIRGRILGDAATLVLTSPEYQLS